MTSHFMLNAACAFTQLPCAWKRTPSPRLIMTLLVKNEEEILEQNLRFHRAMGVDGFIVTDNNSTDSTPDIIRRYAEKGWIVEHIEERGTDYSQKRWVDRMVWLAKRKHGADWIINADADEFWYSPTGNLKTEMQQTRKNVLVCPVVNLCPEDGVPFTRWTQTARHVPDRDAFGLSPYSLFCHDNFKVAHRARGYLQISMGNHKVRMLPLLRRRASLTVFHFPVRSRAQFIAKMVNGGRELERNPSKHGGRHWRYHYQLWKEGRLSEEYDRVVGQHCRKELAAGGYIVPDDRLMQCFKRLDIS